MKTHNSAVAFDEVATVLAREKPERRKKTSGFRTTDHTTHLTIHFTSIYVYANPPGVFFLFCFCALLEVSAMINIANACTLLAMSV